MKSYLIKKTGLFTFFIFLISLMLWGCGSQNDPAYEIRDDYDISAEAYDEVELEYAKAFDIKRFKEGYSTIEVCDGRKYLIVPDGLLVPKNAEEYSIIYKGKGNIYLAATAAMSLFDVMDALDLIGYSSIKAEDWYVDNARLAMENGDILFAGKYSSPDFELLLDKGCNLAIESTMILHKPETLEKIEELGIPVFIERSSYEDDPIGRLEWIKAFGEICGKEVEAEEYFNKQKEVLNSISFPVDGKSKTVAFFYINQNRMIVTKKSSDYVPKMIKLAGGEYVFESLGEEDESKSSSVNMTMEEFYDKAKDADYIIYNATILNPPNSVDDLIKEWELLKDFKAYKDGNIYCMNRSVYQATAQSADVIKAINDMISGNENEMIVKLN